MELDRKAKALLPDVVKEIVLQHNQEPTSRMVPDSREHHGAAGAGCAGCAPLVDYDVVSDAAAEDGDAGYVGNMENFHAKALKR